MTTVQHTNNICMAPAFLGSCGCMAMRLATRNFIVRENEIMRLKKPCRIGMSWAEMGYPQRYYGAYCHVCKYNCAWNGTEQITYSKLLKTISLDCLVCELFRLDLT